MLCGAGIAVGSNVQCPRQQRRTLLPLLAAAMATGIGSIAIPAAGTRIDRSADVCAQTCAWLQILWVCTCAQTYACHAHAHTRARAHTRTHTHIRTNSARRVLNLSKSVHDRMQLQTESPPLKVGRFKSQHGVKSASLENPLLKCDASNPAIEACSKQVDARANEGLV
jgi:hypothetical protein